MKKIIVSCVVLSVAFMSGCSSSGSMSKADKKFAKAEYESAIKLYQDDIKKGKDVANANYKIAEAYRMSNRLPQAETYYQAALEAGNKREDAKFYYGMALKANAKYDEAANQFNAYASAGGKNANLIARAKREATNVQKATELLNTPTYMEVTNVQPVNSAASEYAPVMKGDELVFSSSRGNKTYAGNGEGFNDIFAIKFDDAEAMTGGTVRSFDNQINLSDTHDAAATFSKDGNTVVFARGNTGSKKGTLNVDLFISRFKNGVWSEPKMISVNDKRAWDSSPAFSPDGTTLYFSSDRKGGQGGNDIWKTTLDASGRFSAPQNLGPEINTPGNENFPFVAPDGTLYISSDGHAGLGMLDLYRIENGKPVNLGAPINSNADDFAPFIKDKDQGLFSSNRAGGQGGDDIYAFAKKKPKLVTFYLEGAVNLKEDKKPAVPAANQKVLLKDKAGKTVQEVVTDAQGKFSLKLDTAASYSVIAEKDKYITDKKAITTIGKTPSQAELPNEMNDIRLNTVLTLDKIVVGKAFEVKDINYDYNQYAIRQDAAVNLDSLVMFLNDNPKITIELSSHTDARGKDDFNMKLSQQRAQAAVDYIVSKGIDKSRITAKGYGESKLKNKCKNNVKCTEAEHEKNRRTEFKVTKIAQ
jgi:peptidoglycan-associated lipoprotein